MHSADNAPAASVARTDRIHPAPARESEVRSREGTATLLHQPRRQGGPPRPQGVDAGEAQQRRGAIPVDSWPIELPTPAAVRIDEGAAQGHQSVGVAVPLEPA